MDARLAQTLQGLTAEIGKLAERQARLERGTRTNNLNNAAIDGSALLVKDTDGTVRQVIGAQSDGTVTLTEINGPAGPVPSAPLVTPAPLGISITWDGTFAGGVSQPNDFDHVEVHVSGTSGFTPSSGTLMSTLPKAGTYTAVPLATVAQYVVLVAINRSGAASAPSDQESATPALIGSGDVTFNANGVTVTISPAAPASPLVNDIWFDTSNNYRMNQWNGTTWSFYQFGTNAIANGAVTTAQIAANTILAANIAAGTITAALIAANTITASQIAAGTITAAQIAANAITAAKVAAGVVDGQVITGSTIRNSATNPKTSINPDGSITITNSSGVTLFQIAPDGTTNWYQASGQLLQQIQPNGTQLVYQSLTGPTNWSFETGTTMSWVATASTLSVDTTTWASDGNDSLKVTASGTTTNPWGAKSPAFVVQAGATASAKLDIYTPSALSALELVLTFWSGANGTGSNLGTAAGDLGTIATTAGEIATLTITGATVPAGALSATLSVLEAANATSGQFFEIDNIAIPGGLVYSNSPTGGTDQFGNVYEQGQQFYGIPGQTNTFGVQDPYGTQLASIDSQGNINGQVISGSDMLINGQSIVNDALPTYPAGVIQRGYIPSANLPYPTTAVTGTGLVALYEIDVDLQANRSYLVTLETMRFSMSAAGNGTVRVHGTTDGSQPTTSSDILFTVPIVATVSTTGASATAMRVFQTTAACTLRLVVSLASSGATPAIQVINTSSSTFLQGTGALTVYDMGAPTVPNSWVPRAGGSGTSGGTQVAQGLTDNTWSYSSAGGQRNHNGDMYQGQASGNPGGWGSQYSIMDFFSVINAVPSGAVVNQALLRLQNKRTWYDTGAYLYTHTATSSSVGTFSSQYNQVAFGEGQGLVIDVTVMVAAMVAGSLRYVGVRVPSGGTALTGYGYWAGNNAASGVAPFLKITYTH
jgi:hypothetical protein